MRNQVMDQEEFYSWLEHPATEALMQYINNNIQARKDIAAAGGCLSENGFQDMGQRYFAQMNTITVYENLLEDLQTYEVIFPLDEEQHDDDSTSEESSG